ncbi:ras and EF-hand domain-containing protein-like [Schistocerca serialis cubense]|uniref:ras and EF-hand domain-containing protein-like n=1 Tax=Schistocerca serialis cubense TaxID=2023355 RepID=UPI00214E70A5|nr:ras and EF-hand domain-containing protein-like [Schistocerca serialis cubense]
MEADPSSQLRQLFRSCDRKGRGYIGQQELRDLCAGFDITAEDADTIFSDLDHDGDGRVTVEDFEWGFRHFLQSDEEGSAEDSPVGRRPAGAAAERRHSHAWPHLVAGVGQSAIKELLQTSGQKLAELYEDLQTTSVSPDLIKRFDGAFTSLLQDVKKIQQERKKLEEMFSREKQSHLEHLRSLEEELDVQVARIEQKAKEEAEARFEAEKRLLKEKMEAEMAELQLHLKLFQKVNAVLSKKQEAAKNLRHTDKDTNSELQSSLVDTKTTLAVLRAEMAQLKAEYEVKCRELHEQQQTTYAFINQNDHIYNQIGLLHEANLKLQDTNDNLLSVMDTGGPFLSRPASPCPSSIGLCSSSIAQISRSPDPSDVSTDADSAPHSLSNMKSDSDDEAVQKMRRLDEYAYGRSVKITTDLAGKKSLQEEICEAVRKEGNESEDKNDFHISKEHDTIYNKQVLSSVVNGRTPNTKTQPSLEPEGPVDRTFKIVFAGDAAVGKSSFIFRFCKGVFINNMGSTLGVDFQVKTIKIDNRNVALQLWDTAGQERFRAMTKAYFRRADGVLLLYDVTNERSLLNVRRWIQNIDELTEHHIPVILCGNKIDLRGDKLAQGKTCVDPEHGQKIARDHGVPFFETSSKTGLNITDAIVVLTREMLTQEDIEVHTSSLKISPKGHKSKPCCHN